MRESHVKILAVLLGLCLLSGCVSGGRLLVNTEPTGAVVRLANKKARVKTAPAEFKVKAAVDYRLEAEKEGYQTAQREIRVARGKRRTETIVLEQVGKAQVLLQTEPAGGTIAILGVGKEAAHGETVALDAGTYTLQAAKPGYTPEPKTVTVEAGTQQTVTVPLGKGHGLLVLSTEPKGGAFAIAGTEIKPKEGETTKLDEGTYTVEATLEGYSPVRQEVTVAPSDEMQFVTIQLAKGSGTLAVKTAPAGGAVKVVEQNQTLQDGQSVELPAGKYTLAGTLTGFDPVTLKNVAVKAGATETVTVRFGTGRGELKIVASDPEASIFFEGKEYPGGELTLPDVAYGDYDVTAYRRLSQSTRVSGSAKIHLAAPKGTVVRIELTRKERSYQDRWDAYEAMLGVEEEDYRKLRVSSPVLMHWGAPAQTLAALRADSEFGVKLNAILRVGDRVSVEEGSGKWLIWKRGEALQPEFLVAVDSFQKGAPYEAPYPADPAAELDCQARTLAELAFALHGKRAEFPVVDLEQALLSGNSLRAERSVKDGEVCVLVQGGKDVRIAPVSEAPAAIDDLVFCRLPAASGTVEVTWSSAPSRVLGVADTKGPLFHPKDSARAARGEVTLKRSQKAVFPLAEGVTVERTTSHSCPAGGKWSSHTFKKTDSFVTQETLSRGELGPHDASGKYRRVWVVVYEDGGSLSQRQASASYEVSEQSGIEQGTLFLDRDR